MKLSKSANKYNIPSGIQQGGRDWWGQLHSHYKPDAGQPRNTAKHENNEIDNIN
jgi:hypothetical protein